MAIINGTNLALMVEELDEEPLLAFAQSLKDSGVLDAPEFIIDVEDRCNKAIADVQWLAKKQAATIDAMRKTIADQAEQIERLHCRSPHVNNVSVPVEELAKILGNMLEPVLKSVADRKEPQVSVPVDGMSDRIVKGLVEAFSPVLEALAKHKAPVVQMIDRTVHAPAIMPPALVEVQAAAPASMVPVQTAIDDMRQMIAALPRLEPTLLQQPPDFSTLTEAVDRQTKALKKLVEESKQPDLTPILKGLVEQGERIDKALNRPVEAQKPKTKKLSQDYAGDWFISEVES